MTLREWCIQNNRLDILKEWDYEKNAECSPNEISRGVNTKVWWKCCVCKHSYFQSVSSKTTKNYGCPKCSKTKRVDTYKNTMISKNGSLKQWASENNAKILSEWDYVLNDVLPEAISPFSHKKVYWKCDKGHSYQQSISAKTKENQHCPYCSGQRVLKGFNDLKTWCKNNARLDIINAWDCDKNTVLMDDISYGSNKRVWWRCENGHSYQATIKYKTSGKFNSCPDCCKNRISFPQQALAFYLSQKIEIIENYKNKKLLQKELDIYIPSKNIAVEYDGNYWHRDTEKDIEKDNLCKQNNILLIRIREQGCVVLENSTCIFLNNNSYEELEKAIEKIFDIIQIEKPHINLEKDAIEIYSNIQRYFKDNSLENWCIKNNRTTLLQEWDYKKNGKLNPKNITFGSNIKVWWKCHKCNHSWVVSPNQRTYYNSGCPRCGKNN